MKFSSDAKNGGVKHHPKKIGNKVYSIDRYEKNYRYYGKKNGWLVKQQFSELTDKWKLYFGNTAEYIESIGNNIDMVFIDTAHLTPGELLNWLEVLPFLKEDAIVVIHDTFFMYYQNIKKKLIIRIINFYVI